MESNLDRPGSRRCTTCRQQAGVDESFLRWRGGYLCPTCFVRSQRRRQVGAFLRDLAIMVLALNLLVPVLFRQASGVALANVVLVVGVVYAAIVLHELAHAAAAWLSGGKVFEIRLFGGRVLARTRVGDTDLTLGWTPAAGFCAAAFPERAHIGARTALLLSAGIAANLLCVLFTFPGFDAARLQTPIALNEAIFLGSLLALVGSLWPTQETRGAVPTSSDGLQLIRLLRGEARVDLMHRAYFALEGTYALRRHDPTVAVAWFERGLAEYPDSELLQNNLAVALTEMERYAEALPILERLARSDDPHAGAEFGPSLAQQAFHHALLLNNVAAVTVLLTADPPFLTKALALSRLAIQMFPAQPAFRGTLGAVLVEQGEYEAGLKHLMWAHPREADARGRAYCLAYAAIAYHRKGDQGHAGELLAQAVASDARHYAVGKAQAELMAA